jgi:hypothetical protein
MAPAAVLEHGSRPQLLNVIPGRKILNCGNSQQASFFAQ